MMKRRMLAVLVVVFLGGCVCVRANVTATEPCCPQAAALRHVVLLKFTDDTTPEQARAIEERFLNLKNEIDSVRCVIGGPDISTEGLAQGFTHCFIVTFADEGGRDAYLPHPAHKAFVEFMKPNLDKVLVVDFQSGR